jgi:hypothetical protein
MAVIEVTTFRLRPGADEAAFLDADRQVQTEFFYGNQGLLRRTTAQGDGGEWAVVTSWASAGDAEASATRAVDDTVVGTFMSFLDPTTVRTERYRALES